VCLQLDIKPTRENLLFALAGGKLLFPHIRIICGMSFKVEKLGKKNSNLYLTII
jgi:hypothetical protein